MVDFGESVKMIIDQSAGAVEYIACTFAEG